MADNLPLDYSCPHPSLDDSTPPPLAHVPGNRCSSFATNRETLNARASTVPFLHPLPHSPFLSFLSSYVSSFSVSFCTRKEPTRGFSIPFVLDACKVEARMNVYATMRGESRVHANRDTYTAESCGRVRIYTGNWLRGIHVRGT